MKQKNVGQRGRRRPPHVPVHSFFQALAVQFGERGSEDRRVCERPHGSWKYRYSDGLAGQIYGSRNDHPNHSRPFGVRSVADMAIQPRLGLRTLFPHGRRPYRLVRARAYGTRPLLAAAEQNWQVRRAGNLSTARIATRNYD